MSDSHDEHSDHSDHAAGHTASPNPLDSIREKYVTFIETLASKGIPAPHVLIPLILIAIIAGAALYATGNIPSFGGKTIELTVQTETGITIANANIAILSTTGDTLQTKTTDDYGIAKIENFQEGQTIKISTDGFTTKTLDYNDITENTQTITLSTTPLDAKTISVKIVDETGTPIPNALISMSFTDGTITPSKTTDASGIAQIEIDASNDNSASVTIDAIGYNSQPQTISYEDLQSGQPITLRISSGQTTPITTATQTADYTIKITNEDGPIEKAKVQLIDATTNTALKTQFTQEDGTAQFTNINYGLNHYIKVNAKNHEPQTTTETIFTSDTPTLEITLAKKQTDTKITLTIQDASGPIEAATVNLYDSNTNQLITTAQTLPDGKVQLDTPTKTNTYATIYTPTHLLGFIDDLRAGIQKTITLQLATDSNTITTNIQTTQAGFPITNAQVALYRNGGYNLGIPDLYTNAEGIVTTKIPTTIANAPYSIYAKATADPSLTGQSNIAPVSPGNEINLPIELTAPPAKLTITTNDITTNQPIQSTTINILIENAITTTCTTDTTGKCTLNLPPDKPFQINAQTTGYTPYTTELMTLSSANEKQIDLTLFPTSLSTGTTITLLGIFDSKGTKIREVSNAQKYTAKLLLTIPTVTDKAGVYIRLGNEPTATDSQAYITKYDSNEAEYTQTSTTYDEASTNCIEGDATPANTDPIKWIYLQYPKGFTGSKEIPIQFQVSKTATEPITLSYRAYSLKNNAPQLSPTDPQLLPTLQAQSRKTQLEPQDTCNAKLLKHEIKLSPFTLTCTSETELEICYAATMTTQDTTSASLQATIGKDATLNLDILSPLPIDQIGITTDNYKIKQTTTLREAPRKISFADANADGQSASSTREALQVLPVKIPANQKTKLTIGLTPTKLSASTPVKITLFSGKQKTELELQTSITGTNTFKVQTAPIQIPVATQSTVNVKVLDKFQNIVPEATVSLYECDAEPFNGNEPNEQTSEDGKYKFKITPTGLGEIGIRVTSEGFKTYEQCAITTIAKNFIDVNPESLEFTGLTNTPETQRVTVTNTLNQPIRATASLNCFGDEIPLKIFPTSLSIDGEGENSFALKPIENTTSNTQCLLTINAQIGTYRDSKEIPVTNQLTCPGCTAAQTQLQTTLPKQIVLYPQLPYLQDSQTIEVKLPTTPTCKITNFKPTSTQVQLPPYQTGVLAGLPGVASFTCQTCRPIGNGNFACNMCISQHVGTQLPYVCGICQPSTPIAATGANAQFLQATCQQCASAYSQARVMQFQNPMYTNGMQPIPIGVQTAGFDRTTGSPFHTDQDIGNVFNQYPRQPQGIFPGTPGYPITFGGRSYNNQLGASQYGRFNWKDALIADCTQDEITVTADFSQAGQPVSGTATLQVTMADGTKKDIRVIVQGAGMQAVSLEPQYPFDLVSQYEKCSLSTQYTCKIDQDTFEVNKTIDHTCQMPLDLPKVTFILDEGDDIGAKNCKAITDKDKITMHCDFSKSEPVKTALEKGERLDVKFTFGSTASPDTKLETTCQVSMPPVVSKAEKEPKEKEDDKPAPVPPVTPPSGVDVPIGPSPPIDPGTFDFTVNSKTGNNICADTEDAAPETPMGTFKMTLNYRPADRIPQIIITQKPPTANYNAFATFDKSKLNGDLGAYEANVQLIGLSEDSKQPTLYKFFATASPPQGEKELKASAKTCYVKIVKNKLITKAQLEATQNPILQQYYNDSKGIFTGTAPNFYTLPEQDAAMPINNEHYLIHPKLELDMNKLIPLIGSNTYNIKTTYSCGATEIATTMTKVTLNKDNSGKTLTTTQKVQYVFGNKAANDDLISVILFHQAAKDALNSNTPCQAKIQIGKIPQANTFTVLDETTVPFNAYNYPEAARDTNGKVDLNPSYSTCGTLSANKDIDFIRVDVIRNGQTISLKDDATLLPTDKLKITTCGTTIDTKARIETPNGPIELGALTAITGSTQVAELQTDALSTKLTGLKPGALISIQLTSDAKATTRYYCKQWPTTQDCAENKVTFKYGEILDGLPANCMPGDSTNSNNLNLLICDFIEKTQIHTPSGHLINVKTYKGFGDEVFGLHDNAGIVVTDEKPSNDKQDYKCTQNNWLWYNGYDWLLDRAQLDYKSDKPEARTSICSLKVNQPYKYMPLVELSAIQAFTEKDTPIGGWNAIGAKEPQPFARIKITTMYASDSANTQWFNNYYKYNYPFDDTTGLKQPKDQQKQLYLLKPNDVVKINKYTMRYIGLDNTLTESLFEYRDENGVIIDCAGSSGSGVDFAAAAAGLGAILLSGTTGGIGLAFVGGATGGLAGSIIGKEINAQWDVDTLFHVPLEYKRISCGDIIGTDVEVKPVAYKKLQTQVQTITNNIIAQTAVAANSYGICAQIKEESTFDFDKVSATDCGRDYIEIKQDE